MDTKRLAAALEIIGRHKPDGDDVAAEHDELCVCGNLPFTTTERRELRGLGFRYDKETESWSCFT